MKPAWRGLGAVGLAVVALASHALDGVVRDGSTARPIPHAIVAAGGEVRRTDEHGRFDFGAFASATKASARAVGYDRQERLIQGEGSVDLTLARAHGLKFDIMRTSFFLSRRSVIPHAGRGVGRILDLLFVFLMRNATRAADFFHLPPSRVVELGAQVVL